MKKILSAFMAILVIMSSLTVIVGAEQVNEPTTEDLEAIIKIVKPKLDVPEECSEFTWRFNAKSAYSDASWRFTWETKNDAEKRFRVIVSCDVDGNITSFSSRDYSKQYGQLPNYSKNELEKTAKEFVKKTLPTAYENVKLLNSYGTGIYAGEFIYHYVRYIDGYMFPDNYINVSVDYNTGKVTSLNIVYDYKLEVEKHETIISPEKAEEILGTRQKMELTYLTKTDVDEETKERTIKAFLVYKPTVSYLAVDAGTGEIYDTKSAWSVNDTFGAAGGATVNGALKGEASLDRTESEEGYELTEEELAGLRELEGLISKEDAIKAVTDNKYLYVNPALTAVSANLSKNYGIEKTSAYQNDYGTYIWYISFSNPVIDNKYYSYAYADAAVNAQTGEIISFNCNLNDYYYYSNNKLDIPEIKYDVDAARKIAEAFLKDTAAEKLENAVETDYNAQNMINRIESKGNPVLNIYGAHMYRYTRVNEGIKFSRNYLSVGVDGVTGKVYSFNTNWWTNVEFESPKSAMTPEKALSSLLACDGYGVIYERNITHIYTPVTDNSKRDVCAAFTASLMTTLDNGGDTDKVIEKYAKNIDKDELLKICKAGDKDAVLDFVCKHFGVSKKEVEESVNTYIDTSLFYDKEATARLVYTCYDIGSTYISPFTGKQLTSNGEEYKAPVTSYSYSDLSGHWIEKDALLLADIGVGFESEEFNPDNNITVEEFVKLSQGLNFYTDIEEKRDILSRIEAIRLIIDSLGYEKVATLKGIYKTDFADNSEIKEEDIGYISIAFGFGIVKGDGTNVNAYSTLTRAQAVSLLINAVKTAR